MERGAITKGCGCPIGARCYHDGPTSPTFGHVPVPTVANPLGEPCEFVPVGEVRRLREDNERLRAAIERLRKAGDPCLHAAEVGCPRCEAVCAALAEALR